MTSGIAATAIFGHACEHEHVNWYKSARRTNTTPHYAQGQEFASQLYTSSILEYGVNFCVKNV